MIHNHIWKRYLALAASCIISLILFSSCPVNPPDDTKPINGDETSGSALLRYGSKLYVLGGKDASGTLLSTVRSATVLANGSADAFTDDTSLPEGVAFAPAIGAGTYLYLLGGESGAGPSSTIYYALIRDAGKVGFGGSREWLPNNKPLPEARSRSTAILHDGWIYLIGGTTPSGTTDTIIRAHIMQGTQEGQLGTWYPISEKLVHPVCFASAEVLDDRLYVAGGLAGTQALSDVVSYKIDDYGWLSGRRTEASLPEPLCNAILIADGDDLIMAGGYSSHGASSKVYRFHGGKWALETSLIIDADGPSSGRAAGSLWYLPRQFVNQSSVSIRFPMQFPDLYLAPEAPEAIPGSGLVPLGISLSILSEPTVTVKYSLDGGAETETSPLIFSTSTVTIVTIRSYSATGTSPLLERRFRAKQGSFLALTSGDVAISQDSTSLVAFAMQEPSNDPRYPSGYEPVSSILLRLKVAESGYYLLSWSDASTDSAYSAHIKLSLFESYDLCAEVPDINGALLSEIATTSSPRQLYLQAGTYYFSIEDTEKGRTFGLNILEQ